MIATRAIATLVAAVVVGLAARPVIAGDELGAAVVPADPMLATLVGPSGQVWAPDGHGVWTRGSHGGVAADVHGAVLADTLVVVGKSAPPYRWDGVTWQALRLGERGRTLAGTGPRAAVAIGGQIFVWSSPQWKRVGKVAGPVTALWAASDSKVVVAAGGKVWRFASKRFVEAGVATVVGFAGAAPWGLTRDGQLFDTTTRKVTAVVVGTEAITASALAVDPAGVVWLLGTSDQKPALVRRAGARWETVPAPTLAAGDVPIGFGVDGSGVAVVATRGGGIWLRAIDGTWTAGRRQDLPAPVRPGPGPARMP